MEKERNEIVERLLERIGEIQFGNMMLLEYVEVKAVAREILRLRKEACHCSSPCNRQRAFSNGDLTIHVDGTVINVKIAATAEVVETDPNLCQCPKYGGDACGLTIECMPEEGHYCPHKPWTRRRDFR